MRAFLCMLAVTVLLQAGITDQSRPTGGAPKPGETLSESYRGSQRDNFEYQKVPPIKVFDNLYYVGPGFVSVWLVPTSDGLILIDSAQEPYVEHVLDGIGKAGFDPRNIKFNLITHGHLDHFGGAARIQALSGARVAMLEEDWQLTEKGSAANASLAAQTPKRDMVIKEGDTITSGSTSLKVYRLPGHTPGSASFEFTVHDGKQSHKAFVFGGPGQRNGVEGGTQFLASIERLQRQFADVDVAVHVHSWLATYPYPAGGVFERAQLLAKRKAGEPHPFVDNPTWRQWLATAHAGTLKYIENARAGRN